MEIITRAEAKSQGLKRYFTGKPCRRGHVSERYVGNKCCFGCEIDRTKAYYEANKVKIAEREKAYNEANKDKRKAYYEANKDKITEQQKAYREANKGKIEEKGKAYYEANKEKIKSYLEANKEKLAERGKAWREANPLNRFTRHSLQRIEKAIGKDRINRAEVELGYTQDDFKQHIESLWLDGMSWDNRSEWHIDHIKPLSLFLDEGITDPAIINALDNLQPLWAYDNLSKGAKFEAA